MIIDNKNEAENVDLGLDMDPNILSIKCALAQFMKKLSNTETELKKVLLIKKVCSSS